MARVLWPVNDPQVFAPATLDRGLSKIASALKDEVERLDDHPFAAPLCQPLPPCGRRSFARKVCEIDLPPWRRQKKTRIRRQLNSYLELGPKTRQFPT